MRLVAEEMGLSQTTVLELLYRRGEPVRRRAGLSKQDIHDAIRLYESGWLLKEIATKFGASQEDVRRKLTTGGVVMRSGHGDHGRGRGGRCPRLS